MKLYIFQETNEVRQAKEGEWSISKNGRTISKSDGVPYFVESERKILKGIEIDLHSEFTKSEFIKIDIEKPKKKVKKYLWKLGNLWFTQEHLSEKEIKRRSNIKSVSIVEGSEIEVEE